MAHFAQLDSAGIVLQVIVVNNSETVDANGVEQESIGVTFCQSLFGLGTRWVQTSYNANFRKNYAGIGYAYDSIRDAFIPPQPFPSWGLDEATCRWQSPVPYPAGDGSYYWDEASKSWVPVS
jgi:hypothetical protein